MLGVLLVDRGKEVTVERLIEYLWDDDPPRTARSVIQVQISHLRRSFPNVIRTTAGGYLADIDPQKVDLHRFRDYVSRAQAASDAAEAVLLWDGALSCWRGKPFSGTGSDHLWYTVCQPLLEERWSAMTAWAECAFTLHRYSDIVTRLTPLVREDPLRERLQYLLIAALYRSGQRASALTVFHETQRYLAEELGVDPSPDVMELHQRILQDEDDGADPRQASGQAARQDERSDGDGPDLVVRNDLPRDIPDFTGRERDLRELLEIGERPADRSEVAVITGAGGAGKTTLAVHAAHQMVSRYPDGQFFIDLYGFTVERDPLTAGAALGILLRAIGVDPETVPESVEERSALWRAQLSGKRILIVLDNAVNFAQVSPLLSAAPGSLTIVTTRHDLPGLSGARYLSLGMFDEDSSLRLFRSVLGRERVEAETEQAVQTVRLCGGLPLALRIVAGRMTSRPRWTFAHVAQRLNEHQRRFRELRVDGQSVESVFELSYQSLNEVQRGTFLLLGTMIGSSIDLHGASALLDRDLPGTDDLLQELVSVRLLDEPGVDLYRFHDLIGAYARQKALAAMSAEEIDSGRFRLANHYLDMANRGSGLIGPRGHDYEVEVHGASRYRNELTTYTEAVSWFEKHQENLASVVDFYASKGYGDPAWQLADSLWRFYASSGRTELLLSTQEQALAVSRTEGNERGSAVTLIGLGIAHCLSGRFELSLGLLNEARDILESVEDQRGMARVYGNLGMVYERMGRFHDALSCLWKVYEYASSVQDNPLEALQSINIALMYQTLGDYARAIEFCEAALQIRIESGSSDPHGAALRILGEVNARLGNHTEAFSQIDRALEIALSSGAQTSVIFAHNSKAIALRESGKLEAAISEHLQALELGEESGQRSGEAEILTELGTTYARAKQHKDAHISFEKALKLARERKERHIEGRALMGIGTLPADVVPSAVALERLTTATTIFNDLGVPEAELAQAELQRLRDTT